jgi:hypothetical protein
MIGPDVPRNSLRLTPRSRLVEVAGPMRAASVASVVGCSVPSSGSPVPLARQ